MHNKQEKLNEVMAEQLRNGRVMANLEAEFKALSEKNAQLLAIENALVKEIEAEALLEKAQSATA